MQNFLSHMTEKFRTGTLPFFRKYLVWKKLWIRGGYQDLSEEILLSHSTENFVSGTLVFQKCSGIEKLLDNRGISIFRYVFVSQCRKFLWGTLQCFRKFGVSKNFMQNRGVSRFSVEIFWSHSAENFRKGILLFLRKFLVSKSFMDEKGVSRFSVEIF